MLITKNTSIYVEDFLQRTATASNEIRRLIADVIFPT